MNWAKNAKNFFSLKNFMNTSLKSSANSTAVSPLFYVGTWEYFDSNTKRSHELEIRPNYDVLLDHKLVRTRLDQITVDKISFVDTYGFHLIIRANHRQPISIYDEANNETYAITNN